MNEGDQLFESFSRAGKNEWTRAASAEISGGDPSENLKWFTQDEQDFQAFYDNDDTAALAYLRQFQLNGSKHTGHDARQWINMPEVVFDNESAANKSALEHLSLEAEGVLFSGLSGKIDFNTLLHSVECAHCAVSFIADENFPLSDLINYISEKNYSYTNLNGSIFWKENAILPPALPSGNGLRFAGLRIKSSTPVNEITDALSAGVATATEFISAGYKPEEIIKHISFSIPMSTTLLLDIAKLKALRLLWYQVAHAFGRKEYKLHDLAIHARSEKWINPKYQPHGNMLKSTIAAIAAISGGADSMTIEPEDPTQAMMTRIARNTSVILKEEAHLGKVSDPFAGAYGVDVLIDRIARDAWTKFQSQQ
jgi:methylmalonyl-CoA mutase